MALQPQDVLVADHALVARIATADERALGELYDRYGQMAFSLAAVMLPDAADAEEVVADAFAQIWRSAPSFDPARGSVIGWVATIVRTRTLDLLRSQRRRSRAIERATAMSEDGVAPMLSPAEMADRGVERTEARALIERSLAELPTPQRTVIELAYFGGLSQSEIAEQLAEPLGTIKTRMRAAMEKMRAALRPLLEEAR